MKLLGLRVTVLQLHDASYPAFFSRACRMLRGVTQPVRMPCVVCVEIFFPDQPLSPSWFDRSR